MHAALIAEGTLRIVTQTGIPLFATRGRLDMYYGGHWSSLCYDNGFGAREAHTACQQLGYRGATSIQRLTELASTRHELINS